MDPVSRRIPNFTGDEVEILTILVKKHAHILQSKKINAASNNLKEETWKKLAQEFNIMSGIYERTPKALRGKYENMKKRGRENRRRSDDNRSAPFHFLKINKKEVATEEILDPRVYGFQSEFDDDAPSNDSSQCVVPSVVPQECLKTSARLENSVYKSKMEEITNRVSHYTNPQERLKTSMMENFVCKNKMEEIEHQMRCAAIRMKMKQDAIEHNLRCELLKLDTLSKEKELKK